MHVDSLQTEMGTGQSREAIQTYLQENLEVLLRTLRVFVLKAGLAEGPGVHQMAEDLLGNVITIALQKADTFRSGTLPKSWILGIAAKVTMQEQRRTFRRNQRERSIEGFAEESGLDWWSEVMIPGPEDEVLSRANVQRMLSVASEADRRLVTLYIVQNTSIEDIAGELEISTGAARVRLCRALKRIRKALEEQN